MGENIFIWQMVEKIGWRLKNFKNMLYYYFFFLIQVTVKRFVKLQNFLFVKES